MNPAVSSPKRHCLTNTTICARVTPAILILLAVNVIPAAAASLRLPRLHELDGYL
ncbi:MAG: hypothetical protein WCE46_10855 [Methanoregula sp.]|uniref:hypothetical protein n=1 Tax=Methanoregula sp. TaxID=2052170 RepID=UPI003C75CDDB